MNAVVNDPPLRVGELSAAELVEWAAFEAQARPGLDLINCRDCRNRFGHRCNALNHSHVPLELNHRCAHFRKHARSER